MTIPDKAVEEALDAWFGDGEWRNGVFGKDYLASMSAALAAAEQAMWEPIESAPKGRDKLIDLWIVCAGPNAYKHDPERPGNLIEDRDTYKTIARRMADCYWGGNGFSWCRDGKSVTGRRYYDKNGDDCLDPLCTEPGSRTSIATHWRPLPPPPETKK